MVKGRDFKKIDKPVIPSKGKKRIGSDIYNFPLDRAKKTRTTKSESIKKKKVHKGK
jgi:hypothetical protein